MLVVEEDWFYLYIYFIVLCSLYVELEGERGQQLTEDSFSDVFIVYFLLQGSWR